MSGRNNPAQYRAGRKHFPLGESHQPQSSQHLSRYIALFNISHAVTHPIRLSVIEQVCVDRPLLRGEKQEPVFDFEIGVVNDSERLSECQRDRVSG